MVTYLSAPVDFKRKHGCGFGEVVCVVEWDAEVVGHCCRFVGPDMLGQFIVGSLPLFGCVSAIDASLRPLRSKTEKCVLIS